MPGTIDPQERFQGLLVEMGELLRRVITRGCPSYLGLDPEDVEQEVRLRIWRLVQERSQIDHPRSYLYRLAMNATVDAIRQAKRRREDSLSNPGILETVEEESASALNSAGPASAAEQRLMLQTAERCLEVIPERRAVAVRLYLQGFTVPEVAELKNWTAASARNLVFRGLSDLRNCLKKKGYSDAIF